MNWHKYFEYREDGKLIWKVSRGGGARAGSVAGTRQRNGYVQVVVEGRFFYAHRIVWELFNGKIPKGLHINHKNHNQADNRIENLECVTVSENIRAQRKQVNSSSRYKHVYFHKASSKWRAQIWHEGKQRYLGLFIEEKQAAKAVWVFYIENSLPTETLNFYEDLTLKPDTGERPYYQYTAIRALAKAEPSRRCIITGSPENTVCHHVIPHSQRPDLRYDPENLVWIRADLHRRYHAKYGKNINRETLEEFRGYIFGKMNHIIEKGAADDRVVTT
jgi:hypothetical protein